MARVPPDLLIHLRRARDLADRRYADPLDLATLAQAAGVSRFHFLRCFTAAYGVTPAQYLSRRRIERAQDLLRSTNLTVTEVCLLVGFTSLGSFSVAVPPAGRDDPVAVPGAVVGGRRAPDPGLLRVHARAQRRAADAAGRLSNHGEASRRRRA